jgi:hypothetical protein
MPVSTRTRLWSVRPRNLLSISGSDKRHVASPKRPNRLEAQLVSYSVGIGSIFPVVEQPLGEADYRRTPVSAGKTFQDLPRLRETADNTESYIQRDMT